MKIPKEVRFMSSVYKVDLEKGYAKNLNNNNHNRFQGTLDSNARTIKLDPELPNATEVFFHEIVHMINHHMSINMEEKDVERMGEGLFHVLKENGFIE